MELRPELLPPPVSPERIDELSREIERICGLLGRRLPDAAGAVTAIADFNAMTGHAYVAHDFAEYYESRNLEDFALEAARPAWPAAGTEPTAAEIIDQALSRRPIAPDHKAAHQTTGHRPAEAR